MSIARTTRTVAALAMASALAMTGCAKAGTTQAKDSNGTTEITMWTHSAGNEGEMKVYKQIIDDFNASQTKYKIVQQSFPQSSYNDAIVAAAASKKLPCLMDMDGPIVPNWAWAKYIQPLGLKAETTDKLLPTAIGKYKGETYSAGYWDAALGIFARKSVLTKNNIRIPSVEKPWTQAEFDAALATLKKAGYKTPLDLGTADKGEWWSYAYSPLLQSFGGDEINRDSMTTAQGKLNGPEAVKFFTWFQGLFKQGYASTSSTLGNADFNNGKSALSYTGVWNALDSVKKYGDDLLILPPPDLGNGPKIGGGSWQWGISSTCNNVEGAREYLEFSFQDKYLVQFADNQVVIPATESAQKQSKYFKSGGQLTPFVDFSKKYALARPATPAYPVISSTFEKASKDIMNGAAVQSTLDNAVKDIDSNIKNNDNYGF